MKVKTADLTGAALDWAVAKCETSEIAENDWWFDHKGYFTDWTQGGPIIEREGIATRKSKDKWYAMLSSDLGDGERAQWCQYTFRNVPSTASGSRRCRFDGPTPRIAAMRCYVASKLGDEVDVPEELMT